MTFTIDFHETHAWSTTFVSSSCAEFHEKAANGLGVDTRWQADTQVDRQTSRRTDGRVLHIGCSFFYFVKRPFTET